MTKVEIKIPIDYAEGKLSPKEELKRLKAMAAKKLRTKPEKIKNIEIIKKSLDARKELTYVYSVSVSLTKVLPVQDEAKTFFAGEINKRKKVVIVGSGPAGLFAGLRLAEWGLCPIILEQGKPVEERSQDVYRLFKTGEFDKKSNVCFGEGGAGTFSDGKLNTGINDERIKSVLRTFVEAGAPPEIIYLAKPHVGTDKLVDVVKNIRGKIISLGGEFRFGHKLVDFEEASGMLKSLCILDEHGKEYEEPADVLILGIGHSARDTYEMLYKKGITLMPKPFSMGVRIEHKQSLINLAQFKNPMAADIVGAADYKLSVHLENKRCVYTFCMCPGGLVVNSSSEEGHLATNGMSYHGRNLENSNSALLVSIEPGDFYKSSPLDGIDFQRGLERKAFLLGGGNYNAPAQMIKDFLDGRETTSFDEVTPSYTPGVKGADLNNCLPGFISDSIKEALPLLNQKLKGFCHESAVLTAVESRSSSPVRICRNENYETNIKGIMPIGEGSGYAGGIMSSAVDGIKCAEKIV